MSYRVSVDEGDEPWTDNMARSNTAEYRVPFEDATDNWTHPQGGFGVFLMNIAVTKTQVLLLLKLD